MGGWVEQLYGWRAVFVVAGAPGIVLALLVRFTVTEPPRERFDGGGAAIGDGLVSTSRATRAGANGHAPTHAPTHESWRQALATLARIPSYRHVVLGAGLHSFAFTGSLIWYPAFLTRVHGLDSGEIGTLLAVFSSLPTAIGILLGGLPSIKLPAMGLIVAIYALTFIASLASEEFKVREVAILATVLAVASYLGFIVFLKLQFQVWPAFFTP
jgi:predicted MFS family arabinose efflux permease